MSNARQILAMLQSRAEGDDEHFFFDSLADCCCRSEARLSNPGGGPERGCGKARETSCLRQAVAVPPASPRGELVNLIEMRTPRFELDSVVM